MAATTPGYNPNAVVVSVNGFTLQNYGEDTFCEITGVEPTASVAYGCDGSSAVSFSAINGAKIAITVFNNTPSSQWLANLQQTQSLSTQLAGLPRAVTVVIYNTISQESMTGIGVFTDRPTITNAKAAAQVTYNIECPNGWTSYVAGVATLVA